MLPKISQVDFRNYRINVFDILEYSTQQVVSFETIPDMEQAIQLASEFLKNKHSPTILDIGANIGLFSISVWDALKHSNPHIYAFEPQPTIFNQLTANIIDNRLENITAIHAGVGEKTSQISLPIYDYNKVDNSGANSIRPDLQQIRNIDLETINNIKMDIPIYSLNDIEIDRPVDFIKIDVEGMEIDVLLGATEFLKKNSYPPITFEAWDLDWYRKAKNNLFTKFYELEYDVLQINDENYIAIYKTHTNYQEIYKNVIETHEIKN